ncbi:hypothetical protein JCM1840_003408 [Sporobolomyces johnsonii]
MQAHDPDTLADLAAQYDLSSLDELGIPSPGATYSPLSPTEHGITGEVLIHLDHTALKDVGVHSVGQRLAILKTVYDLKVLNNIPIEEGHYIPPSEELDDGLFPSSQLIGLLTERDDRIRNLEHEVHNLHTALLNLREEALSIARNAASAGKPRPTLRSPTSSAFPHPLSNASTLSRSASNPSRPRAIPSNPNLHQAHQAAQLHPSTAIGLSGLPDSPHSPGVDSPRMADYQQLQAAALHHVQQHSEGGLHPGEYSINGVATPTTPTAPMLIHPDSSAAPPVPSANPLSSSSSLAPHSRPSTATSPSDPQAHPTSTSTSTSTGSNRRDRENTADNPYRSFRVTLEDPCYKVLPAALKKYKINDDWRLYALFICYGNTERCLAYDEKPLLLFQRLKESNDNPVFMLRHIKDIKSPIAVASAKHAARREKRPPGVGGGVERSLMGVNRDGSGIPGGGGGGAPANGLGPNARPTRLHHPPVLLPVGKEREAAAADEEGKDGGAGGDKDKKAIQSQNQGYCIAIYPYLAEREDEFDVAVGDTFIILSKTKGWWVVHRDGSSSSSNLSSSTSSNLSSSSDPPQARKSAWVPAGCLLETSVPPVSLLSASSNSLAASSSSAPDLNSSTGSSKSAPSSSTVPAHEGNAATVPILPSYVVSVSTPGIALMDYQPRGAGELEVRKGQPLRILKRYNHWSYAIKDDGGRGWVPSWFCGRANKGDGTPTTPTLSASAQSALSPHPLATTQQPSQSNPSSALSLAPASNASSADRASTAALASSSSSAPLASAGGKPSISIAVPSSAMGGGGAGVGKSVGPGASQANGGGGGDGAGVEEGAGGEGKDGEDR